jgi:copper homeostasis protein
VLTHENSVDIASTRELIQLARPLEVTFHRAFDECRDMNRAVEDLIVCGAGRVLTSGGKSDAMNGIEALAALERKAGNRIRIMAGGGIRLSNVEHIVQATGIRAVHTSLNTQIRNGAHDSAADGNGQCGGLAPFVVREDDVRAIRSALDAIPAAD